MIENRLTFGRIFQHLLPHKMLLYHPAYPFTVLNKWIVKLLVPSKLDMPYHPNDYHHRQRQLFVLSSSSYLFPPHVTLRLLLLWQKECHRFFTHRPRMGSLAVEGYLLKLFIANFSIRKWKCIYVVVGLAFYFSLFLWFAGCFYFFTISFNRDGTDRHTARRLFLWKPSVYFICRVVAHTIRYFRIVSIVNTASVEATRCARVLCESTTETRSSVGLLSPVWSVRSTHAWR